MKNSKLLIIGKTPLPIGGVTVHVQRLLNWLDNYGIKYEYYDLKKFNFFSFSSAIIHNKYAHLHSSSPVLRLFFALVCLVYRTTAIITYHGNIGRYSFIKNTLDILSMYLAEIPIVLNQESFSIARCYNKKVYLCSAYIPEVHIQKNTLNRDTQNLIRHLKLRSKFIACTNAYNLSFDKNGQEIYGIKFLVQFFQNTEFALIISDPSGNYKKEFKATNGNILFIDYPHSFIEVLQCSDCFIRYTSTDGDSLSIHEAIDNDIPTIATDVVSRPSGVLLVKLNDEIDLKNKIKQIIGAGHITELNDGNRQEPDIIKLYESLNLVN